MYAPGKPRRAVKLRAVSSTRTGPRTSSRARRHLSRQISSIVPACISGTGRSALVRLIMTVGCGGGGGWAWEDGAFRMACTSRNLFALLVMNVMRISWAFTSDMAAVLLLLLLLVTMVMALVMVVVMVMA